MKKVMIFIFIASGGTWGAITGYTHTIKNDSYLIKKATFTFDGNCAPQSITIQPNSVSSFSSTCPIKKITLPADDQDYVHWYMNFCQQEPHCTANPPSGPIDVKPANGAKNTNWVFTQDDKFLPN